MRRGCPGKWSRELRACGPLFFLYCSGLFGQSAPTVPATKAPVAPNKVVEAKLTPKQQRGQRLLRSAQAETASLEPDMGAFVLWKIAEGYRRSSPSKFDELLRDAFTVSLSIEDIVPESPGGFCPELQGCGIKTWLQRSILMAMTSLSDQEALLPKAQPEVQKQVTAELIPRYIAKKDLERARQLIASLGEQGAYPYGSAMELMMALPHGAALEKVAIFSEAVSAYERQGESQSYGATYDDLSGMVMRFWRDVPPGIAEDAIDQILAQAKDIDEGGTAPHLTFSGGGGIVSLNSQYEYRLFELLPVLEELDNAKAESLLRDNSNLKAILDRFPEGIQAVQPDVHLHPPRPGEAAPFRMSVSVGDNAAVAVDTFAIQEQQEIQSKQKERQIMADAQSNPRQAIAEAMSLPESVPSAAPYWGEGPCPRAEVLLQIAQKAGKANPTVAKDALGELRKSLSQASLMTQAKMIDDAATQYVEIGDEDGADKTVKEAIAIAEKLYAKDTDNDDPNRAFKGAWPSTNQWRRCVQTEARFSPNTAEEIVAGIRDPEIATFEKIYFATALLGVQLEHLDVGVRTKRSSSFMIF